MKTKEQREQELYSSGLVDSVKNLFANKNVNINEKYYVLIADYLDSIDEVKDSMLINTEEIAKRLPEVLNNIQEVNLNGIYGVTDGKGIAIEQSLDYESKKLYFFHELTHALQTRNENDNEKCAFYNGHNGMFLTEATTQYTAEILYHVSNGTDLNYRQQPNTARGDSSRVPYSPISEYQYNGDILMLLSKSMDLPLPQVLALGYKSNGREILKDLYESMEGNQGKFEMLMQDLEKIYSIDKIIISGQGNKLQTQTPVNIIMQDKTQFKANLSTYKELMNKTERELVATFVENHDTEYIIQNYEEILKYLTTTELKQQFLAVVKELEQDISQDRVQAIAQEEIQSETEIEFPEGYSINEFGEIIRPERIEKQQDNILINNYQLSFKQRIAQLLKRSNILMNIPFIEKFVDKQLNILPPPIQQREVNDYNSRQSFVNFISNNGKYRDLPPIQRMSDPEKIAQMRLKMEQQRSNEDNQR